MKKYLLWGALPMLLLAGFLFRAALGGTSSDDSTAPAQSSILVSTMSLQPTTMPRVITAYGSVVAGPDDEFALTLPASGIVSDVLVTAGQVVHKSDELALIEPDAQSVADLHRAKNALTAARANDAHVAALLASRLATAADLAAAEQTQNDAEATLAALQANNAGRQRAIVAPYDGMISAVLISSGSFQLAGTVLFRFVDQAGLSVLVGVPETQAAGITPGNDAQVTLLNTNTGVRAMVSHSTAMLDPQTGLIDVMLSLDHAATLGEPVRVEIQTGTLTGYAIPRDAVQNDDAGDYVFQIGKDQLAHRVGVEVLANQNGQAIIAPNGLDASLPLVSGGAYQLTDGAAVRVSSTGTAP